MYFGVWREVECISNRSFLVENQKQSDFDVVKSFA
jgi:hypothetical protein